SVRCECLRADCSRSAATAVRGDLPLKTLDSSQKLHRQLLSTSFAPLNDSAMTAPIAFFPEIAEADVVLANARIVLPDRIVHGSLHVNAGRIEAIEQRVGGGEDAVDCQGDFVLPGLVELHTDNLENNLRPRNGVLWQALPALLAHDANLTAAGITTVLDAIALGDLEEDSVRVGTTTDVLGAIDRARKEGLLRCDHYLHLRCELAYPALAELFEPLAPHPRLRLVS